MKNLERIQTVMKILKIITKIGFVATMVGGIICVLSLGILLVAQFSGIMNTEEAISLISPNQMTLEVAYCSVLVGLVQCFCAMLVCRKWGIYYNMEEKDGDPFVEESAKYMFSSAIFELIMGFVAFIVSLVIIVVFELRNGGYEFPYDTKFSFDAVAFLFTCFLSIVFRYGAEVKKESK